MSDWWGAMPPPDGVTPNLYTTDDMRAQNIACHAVCLSLVTIALSLRLYTRKFITNTLGCDDCCLILSFCLTVTFSGLVIRSYDFGMGRHIWDTPAVWLSKGLKLYTIASWIYTILGTTYRIAILAVYWRIFTVQKGARRAILIGFGTILVVNTATLFAIIWACDPPAKAWDGLKAGVCHDPRPYSYASGAINVIEDLYVLVLPLPMVWGMKMQLARKLRLMAVFGLALFALVASIIRLAKTKRLVSSMDTTRNFADIGFWATIEVNVAILCACLTVLPAFLERHWPSFASIFNTKTSRLDGSGERLERRADRANIPVSSSRLKGQLDSTNTSDEHLTAPRGAHGHITVTHDVEMDFVSAHDEWDRR